MSRPFAAVESFLERILERPAARLFHAHPQPVQLERRIERAMIAHKMVRGGHTYVPSRYRIILNPADLVALQEASDQLPDDLADAILQRARAQGYWLVARPDVVLVPSERIIQGDLEVDAEALDPSLVSSAAAGLRPVELEGPRPPRPPIPGTGVVPDPVSLPEVPGVTPPVVPDERAPSVAEPAVADLPPPAAADPPPPWSLASRTVEVSPAASSPIEPPGVAAQAEAAHMASDVRERVPTPSPWVPQESTVPPPDPFLVVPVIAAEPGPQPVAEPSAVAAGASASVVVPAGPREAGPVAAPRAAASEASEALQSPVAIPVVAVVAAVPKPAAPPKPVDVTKPPATLKPADVTKPPATLKPADVTKPPAAGRSAASEPVVRARIEVQSPDQPPSFVDFKGGTLRVGRGTDNEIVILDERVSRHHGRFAARHGVLVYTDLDSTNGSLVNGLRVHEAGLGVGDVVRLGRTTLTVRPHP